MAKTEVNMYINCPVPAFWCLTFSIKHVIHGKLNRIADDGRMRGNTTHYLSGHWQHGLWCIFCFIRSSTVNRQQVWFNFHYKNSFKVLHVFLQPWLKAKIQLEKNISVWRLEKLKSSKNVSKQWMTTDHWHWPSYFALCSTLPLLTAHCANFTLNTSVRPNFYTVCIRS